MGRFWKKRPDPVPVPVPIEESPSYTRMAGATIEQIEESRRRIRQLQDATGTSPEQITALAERAKIAGLRVWEVRERLELMRWQRRAEEVVRSREAEVERGLDVLFGGKVAAEVETPQPERRRPQQPSPEPRRPPQPPPRPPSEQVLCQKHSFWHNPKGGCPYCVAGVVEPGPTETVVVGGEPPADTTPKAEDGGAGQPPAPKSGV